MPKAVGNKTSRRGSETYGKGKGRKRNKPNEETKEREVRSDCLNGENRLLEAGMKDRLSESELSEYNTAAAKNDCGMDEKHALQITANKAND